jgi:hypothetical protein
MSAFSSPGSAAVLAAWLEERRRSIADCELRARSALYVDKDEQSYRELMTARARQIAALAEDSASLVAALPDPLRQDAAAALALFSEGAEASLRIGSVFYMYALLYPDGHKEGEPDNLQRLIAELAYA